MNNHGLCSCGLASNRWSVNPALPFPSFTNLGQIHLDGPQLPHLYNGVALTNVVRINCSNVCKDWPTQVLNKY